MRDEYRRLKDQEKIARQQAKEMAEKEAKVGIILIIDLNLICYW